MAIRQYIGARYVPRFMGTYDATQIYDALDVVDNGSGTSYIARKTVPAGTALTDNEFWFIYGASSGAIIALQNDVNDINNNKIPALQSDIDDINNVTIPGIRNDIAALDRNILILGNSYVNQGLCNILEKSFKNHYHFTSSGAGFVPYTGHSDNFDDVLDAAISDTTYDHNSITDILIVSAAGDTRAYTELGESAYLSNLESTLSAMESKISSNYPNATRIGVVLGESRTGDGYDTLRTITSIFKIHRIFNTILGKYRFEYIGWAGFNIMFESGMMDSDAVHLTALGYKTAGTWLARAYFGNADYKPYIASNATAEIRYTARSTVKAYFIVFPDRVIAKFGSVSIVPGDTVTISNNNTLFVGTATAINLNKPIPGPEIDDILYTDFVDPYTGNSIEKCRLQITAASSGILRIIYFGTPRGVVPSGVSYMGAVTLYNYGYNI